MSSEKSGIVHTHFAKSCLLGGGPWRAHATPAADLGSLVRPRLAHNLGGGSGSTCILLGFKGGISPSDT